VTLYAETSAVLRWLFAQPGGEEVRRLLARAARVASSRLTLIETRRVVRRAAREARISSAESVDLLALFAGASSTWNVLEVSPLVAQRAEEPFPVEPVRTLDAIHLASALLLRQSFPDLEVVTADERMRANAAQLGLRANAYRA
jgi:predicted nucleic acid-binding protein